MVNISKLTPEQLQELMFTAEEQQELTAARAKPFVYDEDCPPVTAERAKYFHRAHRTGKILS